MFEAVLEPVLFRLEDDQYARGFPWRVMTISCASAYRRKPDRSSLTSDRGTSFTPDLRIVRAMTRLRFGHYCQNLDGRTGHIVENPDIVYPQPILRTEQSSRSLDATAARSLGLVPQMRLERSPDVARALAVSLLSLRQLREQGRSRTASWPDYYGASNEANSLLPSEHSRTFG